MTDDEHTASIGSLAVTVLALDDSEAARAQGVTVLHFGPKRCRISGPLDRLFAMAVDLRERGDASGEGWALSAGERRACRRASDALAKALGRGV